MKDHLQFLCPHCLQLYHGDVEVGQQTRCDNCGKVFVIVQHVTNPSNARGFVEESPGFFNFVESWRRLNFIHKCPLCKVRGIKQIQLGALYYRCNSCNRTFEFHVRHE